jgi:restriction endonuclease S subunit
VSFTAPVTGYYYIDTNWSFNGKAFDDDIEFVNTELYFSAKFWYNSFASNLGGVYFIPSFRNTIDKTWTDYHWNPSFASNAPVKLDKGTTYELRITMDMQAWGAFPGSSTDFIDFYNYAGIFLERVAIKFAYL